MNFFKRNIILLFLGIAFYACDASKPSALPQHGGDPVPKGTNANPEAKIDTQIAPLPNTGTDPLGHQNSTVLKEPDRSKLSKDCYDASKANAKALCPDLLEPVCGCDGVNYSNECEAKKIGILKWTAGRCK